MSRIQKKMRKLTDSIGLYTEQEMARIHEYECLRTDRNRMKFSHIALEFDFDQVPVYKLNATLGKLLRQLRMTDHIGWESTSSIGIILPGTDEIGARHFVSNTEKLLGRLAGISISHVATLPLPETILAAVSASSPGIESTEAVEVSIIPFK